MALYKFIIYLLTYLLTYGVKLEREKCGKKGKWIKPSQTTTETGGNVKGTRGKGGKVIK